MERVNPSAQRASMKIGRPFFHLSQLREAGPLGGCRACTHVTLESDFMQAILTLPIQKTEHLTIPVVPLLTLLAGDGDSRSQRHNKIGCRRRMDQRQQWQISES